ncbi:sigma-70 family RNA polymerase sigma factor [Phenylobacterium sp.]|uniref:RNA polymerase sigma factor n=1 Tax=Phenylobacterium sp. TaxID=1871053 RepID=UPI0025F5225C|nr:sigma-70 family RNA polymerase sigma factor [Phenylobacterium sp.]
MTGEGAPDAALAARALAGDDAAFGRLMRAHTNDLFRFARRYTGDPDAAGDVVQDTFVSAWKALARYDDSRPFGVWLRAIALNKCRDRARRRYLRRVVLGQADPEGFEAQSRADPSPDAEMSLITRQRLDRLDRAVAGLPAGLKEPLILTVFEGLSQQAAGEVLGLTAKAVEIRVYRARRRLAELLQLGDDAS